MRAAFYLGLSFPWRLRPFVLKGSFIDRSVTLKYPGYYLEVSDDPLETGAEGVAGAPDVGLCCPVIFEKFAFSCSGSA